MAVSRQVDYSLGAGLRLLGRAGRDLEKTDDVYLEAQGQLALHHGLLSCSGPWYVS